MLAVSEDTLRLFLHVLAATVWVGGHGWAGMGGRAWAGGQLTPPAGRRQVSPAPWIVRSFSRSSHLWFSRARHALDHGPEEVTGGTVSMKRKRLGGFGRTALPIAVLVAGGVVGLAALESSLAPAPAPLPRPVVIPAPPSGNAAPTGSGTVSARSGEQPEAREPVQVVAPRRTVIIVPAAPSRGAAKDA